MVGMIFFYALALALIVFMVVKVVKWARSKEIREGIVPLATTIDAGVRLTWFVDRVELVNTTDQPMALAVEMVANHEFKLGPISKSDFSRTWQSWKSLSPGEKVSSPRNVKRLTKATLIVNGEAHEVALPFGKKKVK